MTGNLDESTDLTAPEAEELDEETTVVFFPAEDDITLSDFDNNQLRLVASIGQFEFMTKGIIIEKLGVYGAKKWLAKVKKMVEDFSNTDPEFSILKLKNGRSAAQILVNFVCSFTKYIRVNIGTNKEFTLINSTDLQTLEECEAFCIQLRNLLEG